MEQFEPVLRDSRKPGDGESRRNALRVASRTSDSCCEPAGGDDGDVAHGVLHNLEGYSIDDIGAS